MELEEDAFEKGHEVLPKLTKQQEQFVRYYLLGYSTIEAGKAAGYSKANASKLLNHPVVQRTLTYFREKEFDRIAVTRESITKLFFEAHRKSGNTTEEVAALREIAKMHGLYEPQRIQTISVNINSERHIEAATDADLLKLAGLGETHFDPSSTVDGEFEEVGAGNDSKGH
jgi:phage terminase small subunit